MNSNNQIALFGIQQQGLEIAEFLSKNGFQIDCFVTISELLAKKNNAAGWVDYSGYAEKNGIEVYYCRSYGLKHEQDVSFLKEKSFKIVLLGGWQRLLSEEIISTVNGAVLGQHGSSEFLPRGRGRSPLNWSIIENRKRLVWNLFKIAPGVDDGEVLDYEICDINEWDDCQTLYYKVSIMVKHMMLRTIPKILDGSLKSFKQVGEPTFYPRRTPDDGKIDWQTSVYHIDKLIRAVTHPYPGAFTLANGEKIMIWKAQIFDSKLSYLNAQPGQVMEVFESGDFVVNGVDGLLLIRIYENFQPKVGDQLR